MQTTHYCTEFIEYVRSKHESLATPKERALVHGFNKAVKFRLPDDGVVLNLIAVRDVSAINIVKTYRKYIEMLKLPFKDCLFEFRFFSSDKDSREFIKYILLASEEVDGSISFFSVIGSGNNKALTTWRVLDTIGFIDPDLTLSSPSFTSGDSFSSRNAVLYGANIILSFLSAIQCSNIEIDEVVAPKMLNKKREKKGKPLFSSYKVLTLNTKGAHTNEAEDANTKENGGSNSRKRQHLRRGHIRRYKDRSIWVNPCVVGDKNTGSIQKTYKVK